MHFSSPLTPEDMMVQSCAEASPVKWHLAHTSWFFETFVLSEFVRGYQPFHPDFRWLFNSYYNAVGEMPEKKLRASFSRPPLDEILAYRRHVDAAIARLLEQTPEDEALRRIALGLEHEQQHLELAATDIKHAFFTNPLHPAYITGRPRRPSSMDETHGAAAGVAELLRRVSAPAGRGGDGRDARPQRRSRPLRSTTRRRGTRCISRRSVWRRGW